ncbi:MAG: tyrosine-type recombinase/integrase [Candidatus Binatia bacterium]
MGVMRNQAPPQQPALFELKGIRGEFPPTPLPHGSIDGSSALSSVIPAYHAHLMASSYADNTIKAYLKDLQLLVRFLGPGKEIGQVTTDELKGWLAYLRKERGVPLSKESLRRRIFSVKSFFGWLHQEGHLDANRARPLVPQREPPPLPEVLYDDECEQLLAAASDDSRAYLLVLVLLETGVKRKELLKIKPTHIDLSNQYRPVLWVRGEKHKERKLQLPAVFTEVFEQYLEEYQPQEKLFECTGRNLDLILKAAAEKAGIEKPVSCQILRDTYAVRQLKAGADIEKVLEKLGLAPDSFNKETRRKYLKLAAPAL